jgi:hypothetical protein
VSCYILISSTLVGLHTLIEEKKKRERKKKKIIARSSSSAAVLCDVMYITGLPYSRRYDRYIVVTPKMKSPQR